jgi:twitching motility two-component system response regulator PilH
MATVVIADDSPTLRRIVSSVLSKAGYEVVQAEDGVEAVQAVFRTQPDAVVLDVQMPRVSGYVAARLLKDDWQTADIPIVLLTSLDAASDRYWGAQTGADRYLTKDFEAPDLTGAVDDIIAAAANARDGRPPLRPDSLELTEEDVLSRVCDLLDRKLFETSVAAEVTELAVTSHGFEQTVADLLAVLRRFVDYDLAAVLLAQERAAYVSVSRECSQAHFSEFLSASADTVAASAGVSYSATDLDARVADVDGLLGADDEGRMATFLSMPLRGHGGNVLGVLALSSATKNAFGETALATLRLVEGPAAIVVDNARLAGARTH